MTAAQIYQSAELQLLDDWTTVICIAIGIVTFPLSLFAHYRLLVLPTYKKNYLFKLIIINGFTCPISYLVTLILDQFPSWSAWFPFYDTIQSAKLAPFCLALDLANVSIHTHSDFFVSLNRLIYLLKPLDLHKIDRKLFFTSLLITTIVSITFFTLTLQSSYSYREILNGYGQRAWVADGVDSKYLLPSTAYFGFVGFAGIIINFIMAVILFKRRKRVTMVPSKIKDSTERGLVIRSMSSAVVKAVVIFSAVIGNASGIEKSVSKYVFTVFHALNMTLPFWFLLIFCKTVRREIFPILDMRHDSISSTSGISNKIGV